MLIQKHIVNPRKHLESGGGGSANSKNNDGKNDGDDDDDEESLVDNDPLSQSESVRCFLLLFAWNFNTFFHHMSQKTKNMQFFLALTTKKQIALLLYWNRIHGVSSLRTLS